MEFHGLADMPIIPRAVGIDEAALIGYVCGIPQGPQPGLFVAEELMPTALLYFW
jgi:hypothetical protein